MPPRTAEPPSTTASSARYWPITLTLISGLLLSVAAFALVRTWETERVAQEFQWRAESRARTIENMLRAYEESLYAMRDAFHATKHLTKNEFHAAATAQLARHRGLETLEWLPLVRQAERAQFEQTEQKKTWPEWVIRDQPDSLEPAGAREIYLPVLYCEPLEGREAMLGTDQFLGQFQRATQQAMDTGRLAATRRVALDATKAGSFGVAVLLPVYRTPEEPKTPEQRKAQMSGLLRGVFRLRDLAERSVLTTESPAVDLLLVDHTPAGTEPHLFSLISGRFSTEPLLLEKFQHPQSVSFPLMCAGRRWILHARPEAEWLAARRTYYPAAFFVAGLCLTALLASRQNQRRRRTEEVERLVTTRTEELRRTQEQLREDVRQRLAAEERYRAFVEQSTEAIWHFEIVPAMPLDLPEEEQIDYVLDHAIMAECNDVCARMYGHAKAEDMVGVHLREIMPRENPANLAHLRDYVRTKFRIVDSESYEIDRNGTEHIFLNNIIGIIEDGKLARAWGTQRDVTEQRRFEVERAENEKRLHLAMAAASVGTWEWDRRTNRAVWSDQINEIFGVAPGGLAGTHEAYLALIHPDDRERVSQTLEHAALNGGEFEYEYRILRPNGEVRWITTRGDVRRDAQGEVVGMLGAALDITARKTAESERVKIEQKLQETQKLESLGVLAGGIAHDFNNLLTGILGNASLARMDLAPGSPVQQNLGQIEQASQRAADLCKQMLAYSGKGRFVVQSLDLSQLIEDVAPLLQVSVSKSAVLKYHLTRNLPAVSADATQLRQILMNLVINASDAFNERSGVIEISTGVLHADRAYLAGTYLAPNIPAGEYVFLEVSDNGCGMDAETQKRIFDPFFTTKFTGRGLGLAAVLGIVRGHSGALKVYSEPGQGSTFKLLLPCVGGPAEALPREETIAESWRGAGLVLVVDDEDTVRMVATRMLRAFGFEPIVATNGREALDLFRERAGEIVAVMLDLTMPQMDGAETFGELRRLDPNVRVLLMSGFNEQDAINRFAGKGLAGFLQKPFRPDALREKLRGILAPQ